jgi:hypothetical protein
MVFWVVTPCSDVISVSENLAATIFRVKMRAAGYSKDLGFASRLRLAIFERCGNRPHAQYPIPRHSEIHIIKYGKRKTENQ